MDHIIRSETWIIVNYCHEKHARWTGDSLLSSKSAVPLLRLSRERQRQRTEERGTAWGAGPLVLGGLRRALRVRGGVGGEACWSLVGRGTLAGLADWREQHGARQQKPAVPPTWPSVRRTPARRESRLSSRPSAGPDQAQRAFGITHNAHQVSWFSGAGASAVGYSLMQRHAVPGDTRCCQAGRG